MRSAAERAGRMKRGLHRLIGIVAVLSALLFGVSCAVEEPVQEPEPEREEITLWHSWDMPNCRKELAELAEDFNGAQDRITVLLQYVPEEDFRKQLALSMAEDVMPDIALVGSSDFSFFHHMEPFACLDGQIEGLEMYLPQILDVCMVDGSVYGLPFQISSTALFYNKKILEEAGVEPPRTWEEFENVAVRVSENGCTGLGMGAGVNEGTTYAFLPVLWSMGADPLHIDSREGRQAYELAARLAEQGGISRLGVNMTLTDTIRQFSRQEVAMIFMNSTGMAQLDSGEGLEFGVVPIPEGTVRATIMGGEILTVSPGGNVEASMEFLRYLADPERMEEYLDGMGFLSPRKDVLENQYREKEEFRIFIESLSYASLRPDQVWWPEVSNQIAMALRRAVTGEDVYQVLEEAQKEIDGIVSANAEGEG